MDIVFVSIIQYIEKQQIDHGVVSKVQEEIDGDMKAMGGAS
jgi:hypothetical protein